MFKRRSQELDRLPWRGPGPGRPDLRVPPAPMPVRSGGAWRKRWRYVGAFGERVMLCGAFVRIGPLGQTFWAVLDRESGELHERTRHRLPAERGEVWTERSGGELWELGSEQPGARTKIESGELAAKLKIGEGEWVESICPNGSGGYVWTRKRITPMELDLHLPDGRRIQESLHGIEDESAGYHPRRTVWSWSAGVGETTDGRRVGWNLVAGVNDPPENSERAIWVEGEPPREPGPVRFDGLEAVESADGSRLGFSAEAERRKEEDRWLVKYAYRQPFGTFHGSLDGIELASGIGVMEHHDALW